MKWREFWSGLTGALVAISLAFSLYQAGELIAEYIRMKACIAAYPTAEAIRQCVSK